MDSIKGAHHLGYARFGHEHWRKIDPARVESGAAAYWAALSMLPPETVLKILQALVGLRVVTVTYELFVQPVAVSLELEKQKKAQPAPPKEPAPDKPQ